MTTEPDSINRRTFIGSSGKAALGALALGMAGKAAAGGKMRLAMVGTGSRGTETWGRQLMSTHSSYVELVGFCDINPKRAARAPGYCGVNAPTFAAADFEKMISQTKPDAVIVTTT